MNKFYAGELYHYGISGQKWGVRRYENEDGTLTEEGKRRYGNEENYRNNKTLKQLKKENNQKIFKEMYKLRQDIYKDVSNEDEYRKKKHEALLDDTRESVLRGQKIRTRSEQVNREMMNESKKRVDKMLSQKYGKTALDDAVMWKRKSDGAATAAVILAGTATALIAMPILDRLLN